MIRDALESFLTSDVHLGMKFAGYPEVQVDLSEARFSALERLVGSANENQCNLFVIAGDLFDRVTVSKRDVIRAAHLLKDFQGPLVAVLPGNHDFISRGQTDLWTPFKENAGDRVLLLEERKTILSPITTWMPLSMRLHAVQNIPTTTPSAGSKKPQKTKRSKYHIGIAHGSLEGFSPDFDERYYPMTAQELLACGMDLWLMGHTHIPYPSPPGQTDRVFYPGTPEPDGFDCQHEGKAWVLELAEDRRVTPLSLSTGMYRFLHDEVEIKKRGRSGGSEEKVCGPRAEKNPFENEIERETPERRVPELVPCPKASWRNNSSISPGMTRRSGKRSPWRTFTTNLRRVLSPTHC